MKTLLLSIPFITTIFGIYIYKFQDGKREIFRLDLAQFFYLFVLGPALFVWMKSFLFFLLRSELELGLSATELFVVDTIFSLVAFFVFVALSIHSLTKTFRLKRMYDPKFDLFHLSEYFHLWWSHIAIWLGGLVLISFFSILDLFFPFLLITPKWQFYATLGLGSTFGLISFVAVWMSDPQQGNFMRLMKILFGLFFLVHVVLYFVMDPVFNMTDGIYWFVFFSLLSLVSCSFFFERYDKTNRVRNFFLHDGWGNNINIFDKRK